VLKLVAHKLAVSGFQRDCAPLVKRVSTNPKLPIPLRADNLLLVGDDQVPDGFAGYLVPPEVRRLGVTLKTVALPEELSYLRDGDVIRVDPQRGHLRVLYRRNSKHNSLLLTERCNHYCLMCSQPPKNIDDSWIISDALEVLRLADLDTPEIGFTGGEPTLLGESLIRLLRASRNYLPQTAVHLLTNGRAFADFAFTKTYASVQHPDLVAGIPVYSDVSTIHDYIVQADGAFDETIRGILHLKQLGQQVEIRVVIHKQTVERLPWLAEFIARNLTFVDHVALMGLEVTGFTLANLKDLWIDPFDYRDSLRLSTEILAAARIRVSIYNHQLCVLDPAVWRYSKQSISDWKNEYFRECATCVLKDECGGFFSSAVHRYSDHIVPFEKRPDWL